MKFAPKEQSIEYGDPQYAEKIEALMHSIHLKLRSSKNWAAAYVLNESGTADLHITFGPDKPATPEPEPEV